MNWIKIVTGLPDDPKIHEFAECLRLDTDRAIAKFVRILLQLPEHARSGDLSGITPATIERWADWRGKRGLLDESFRRLFCNEGVVAAWEKHNGAAIRRADEDRDRKRKLREKPPQRPQDKLPTNGGQSTGQNADAPQDIMRDGTGRDGTERKAVSATTSPPLSAAVDTFLEAWSRYPKRSGSNSRADARRSWNARIRAGTSADLLLAGVDRYATYIRATGKEHTEFVMQGARFFGPGEHWSGEWAAPANGTAAAREASTAATLARASARWESEDAEVPLAH